MPSKFAVLGHPIHPMLIPLPIGLFVFAFAADIVYVLSDQNQTWYDIAFWSGIAGTISALIAALPGLGDFLYLPMGTTARMIATLHMGANLTVVALFFVAILLMLDNGAREGARLGAVVALHAVGIGLLALSGWLGGEMVYRYGLGVERVTDDRLAPVDERERASRRPLVRQLLL
jgi:uncharacterized membrane protein